MTHQMVHAYIENNFKILAQFAVLALLIILFQSCGLGQDILSQTEFVEDRDVALEIISGNGQVGVINQALAFPLVVRAIDDEALPSENERIEFTVIMGSASVTSVSYTDANGLAEATVSLGPNTEQVQIKAYWPRGEREAIFDITASIAILQVESGPGYNGAPDCVRENQEFGVPYVVELIGPNDQPIANTDVLVTISNGSLDQSSFENSVTYTTASNGKITFDVVAGATDLDQYKKEVRVTAVVPSMLDVQPIILELETTRDKFIEAVSSDVQYSESPHDQTHDFAFTVKVLGECDAVLIDEPVQFERRWSAQIASPCDYDQTAPYHQDWYDLGAAVSNDQGFATYTRNLEVRYWEESFIWTRHNDVRATLFNTINGNSKQFAANHYLCQD
ncbi:MAG TPA: hypothetical protein PKC21_01895 [Oligoflexia bacterium]|nr:hypothetical protein [Oligoflexia bacterium]HMR24083.1 hypothetical protein [Oligoflexia bacterium]